jgi:methyl-accepting chemotaxis protein
MKSPRQTRPEAGPGAIAGMARPHQRSRLKMPAWIEGLGIKVKLQVAFAAVSIMTVAAAGVAITSFSATEYGVQGMANREVPLMTDALRLSAISGEISAAAAHFVSAKTGDEQKAIAATIQERYRALTATMERLRQGRTNGTFAAVEIASQRLGVNLQALATAIAERSTLRSSLEAKLDAVHKVHAKIGDKLNPIVDDSYFDVVTTAEDVGKTADKIVKALVNDGLQAMQAIVDVGAETNLVTGLLTAGALTSSGPILTLLEDRFTSSTSRVQKQLAKLPKGPKFDSLRERVTALVKLADFKARAAGENDATRLQKVFRAHESLTGVLISLVDDLNFDLVMQSEDAVKRSSKVIKDLVTNQIAGLRNALEIAARTHLVASVISEASVAKDAAMLVPFRDRFRALADSLVKVSNTIADQEVKKAIADLLALGQGDDGVLALRGKELEVAARADRTIEENTKIQQELDRGVSILVNETEQRMRLGIEQLTGQLDHNRTLLILAAILSLAVSGAIAVLYVQRNLIRRLFSIRDAMRRLSSGDTGLEVPAVRDQDEIGEMARAVLVFRDRAVEKERLENEAAEQRRAGAQAQATAAEEQRRTTEEQTRVVRALNAGLGRLSEGDLTFRLTDDFPDAYEEIKDEFNLTVTRLKETIEALSQATHEVSNASTEISASAMDLSQRTEEQAASLEQTSASLEDISATVRRNAANAQKANASATSACDMADRNGRVVAKAVDAMARIEQSSRKISDIIGVIDEIARQTNLLALNAAVEAARAGEAGRGFAVVASEVRSLAQRSSQAAKDIKDLITSSSGQVREGVDLVNKAGGSLTEIVGAIKNVAAIVSDIAEASGEQAAGLEQVSKALAQMDSVTQQNSALVEENAATAQTLDHQAKSMDERFAFFRYDDEDAIRTVGQGADRMAKRSGPELVRIRALI